ncbi:MAG: hypothetical protein ABIM62_06775 [candidate division WOR-3 bacterium]
MYLKSLLTGGGLVLLVLVSLNLFPCGNAPLTNLGNYQIPIIQSTPPVLMTPNNPILPNPQTLQEGLPVSYVNTRAGNLTFK